MSLKEGSFIALHAHRRGKFHPGVFLPGEENLAHIAYAERTMKDTAVLLIDCPDRKGLVARVAGLLYEHGANILHADQHQDHDLGLVFHAGGVGLIETQSGESSLDLDGFQAGVRAAGGGIGDALEADSGDGQRPRVALFCSQYLHCMADLLHRWRAGELNCEIPVIVSNHRAVENLALFYEIPFESDAG